MPFLCLHICVRDDYSRKIMPPLAEYKLFTIADESTAKKRVRESNLFSWITLAKEVPKQSDHHVVRGLVKFCAANSGGRLAVLGQEKSW